MKLDKKMSFFSQQSGAEDHGGELQPHDPDRQHVLLGDEPPTHPAQEARHHSKVQPCQGPGHQVFRTIQARCVVVVLGRRRPSGGWRQ